MISVKIILIFTFIVSGLISSSQSMQWLPKFSRSKTSEPKETPTDLKDLKTAMKTFISSLKLASVLSTLAQDLVDIDKLRHRSEKWKYVGRHATNVEKSNSFLTGYEEFVGVSWDIINKYDVTVKQRQVPLPMTDADKTDFDKNVKDLIAKLVIKGAKNAENNTEIKTLQEKLKKKIEEFQETITKKLNDTPNETKNASDLNVSSEQMTTAETGSKEERFGIDRNKESSAFDKSSSEAVGVVATPSYLTPKSPKSHSRNGSLDGDKLKQPGNQETTQFKRKIEKDPEQETPAENLNYENSGPNPSATNAIHSGNEEKKAEPTYIPVSSKVKEFKTDATSPVTQNSTDEEDDEKKKKKKGTEKPSDHSSSESSESAGDNSSMERNEVLIKDESGKLEHAKSMKKNPESKPKEDQNPITEPEVVRETSLLDVKTENKDNDSADRSDGKHDKLERVKSMKTNFESKPKEDQNLIIAPAVVREASLRDDKSESKDSDSSDRSDRKHDLGKLEHERSMKKNPELKSEDHNPIIEPKVVGEMSSHDVKPKSKEIDSSDRSGEKHGNVTRDIDSHDSHTFLSEPLMVKPPEQKLPHEIVVEPSPNAEIPKRNNSKSSSSSVESDEELPRSINTKLPGELPSPKGRGHIEDSSAVDSDDSSLPRAALPNHKVLGKVYAIDSSFSESKDASEKEEVPQRITPIDSQNEPHERKLFSNEAIILPGLMAETAGKNSGSVHSSSSSSELSQNKSNQKTEDENVNTDLNVVVGPILDEKKVQNSESNNSSEDKEDLHQNIEPKTPQKHDNSNAKKSDSSSHHEDMYITNLFNSKDSSADNSEKSKHLETKDSSHQDKALDFANGTVSVLPEPAVSRDHSIETKSKDRSSSSSSDESKKEKKEKEKEETHDIPQKIGSEVENKMDKNNSSSSGKDENKEKNEKEKGIENPHIGLQIGSEVKNKVENNNSSSSSGGKHDSEEKKEKEKGPENLEIPQQIVPALSLKKVHEDRKEDSDELSLTETLTSNKGVVKVDPPKKNKQADEDKGSDEKVKAKAKMENSSGQSESSSASASVSSSSSASESEMHSAEKENNRGGSDSVEGPSIPSQQVIKSESKRGESLSPKKYKNPKPKDSSGGSHDSSNASDDSSNMNKKSKSKKGETPTPKKYENPKPEGGNLKSKDGSHDSSDASDDSSKKVKKSELKKGETPTSKKNENSKPKDDNSKHDKSEEKDKPPEELKAGEGYGAYAARLPVQVVAAVWNRVPSRETVFSYASWARSLVWAPATQAPTATPASQSGNKPETTPHK